MNQTMLVGRIASDPEVVETKDGKKLTKVVLAINRSYKNADGVYDTDFISCTLWNNMATTTSEYCKVGDVVGIKGRLQTSKYEDENKKTHYITDVIAERVTFLSSAKKKEKSDEMDM